MFSIPIVLKLSVHSELITVFDGFKYDYIEFTSLVFA